MHQKQSQCKVRTTSKALRCVQITYDSFKQSSNMETDLLFKETLFRAVELNIKRKQDFLRMQRTAMPEAELKRCADDALGPK